MIIVGCGVLKMIEFNQDMRPDFGPLMLKVILGVRMRLIDCNHCPTACRKCRRRYEIRLRQLSRLTVTDLDLAKKGVLKDAKRRLRLWCVLGYVPEQYGFRLLDDGTQERIFDDDFEPPTVDGEVI